MKRYIVLALPLLLAACAEQRATPAPVTRTASPSYVAPQPSAEVREAQQRLQAQGIYNGPIDGIWGPDTEAAIERFQRGHGLQVTGRLDNTTVAEMRRDLPAVRTSAAGPIPLSNPTDVRAVQNRLRQLRYYDGVADGVWGPRTQVAMERFQRANGLQVGQMNGQTLSAMGLDAATFPTRAAYDSPRPVYDPPRAAYDSSLNGPLEPRVVRAVQQRLRQARFYNGPIDGVWGSRTEAAVERFQRNRGLDVTGDLNPDTAAELGLDPNNLSASAGTRRTVRR